MHITAQVTALAAILSLAQAAPTISEKGFSLKQEVPKLGPKKPGPVALRDAYVKYRAEVPDHVSAAAAAASSGTVVASPQTDDISYLIPVVVGGTTLHLDLDTGSSDLWVFSSELPAADRKGHSVYTPSASKLLSGATWSISYGDGSSASGNVYKDTVKLGAVSFATQAVEAAKTISSEFVSDTATDGLIGMAMSSINTVSPTPQKTFFDNIKAKLTSPLFTCDLKKGQPGSYDFGYIDASKHTGSISYINVKTSRGFWEFTGTGYGVGTGSFVSTSIDGIADTGTTLLLLPAAVVKGYYAKVSSAKYSAAQGGYLVSCTATLPDLVLGIGSYRATIPGSYLNYAAVSASQCYGGLQSNAGIGISIYGDIFLKAQFVVFDGRATPRLGFAPKAT